jgi:hypothetical protein
MERIISEIVVPNPLSRRRRSAEIVRFHLPKTPPLPHRDGWLTLADTHRFPDEAKLEINCRVRFQLGNQLPGYLRHRRLGAVGIPFVTASEHPNNTAIVRPSQVKRLAHR